MKINYPNGIKKEIKQNTINSRGMLFENELNESNKYYLIHNKAIIYKKPTPVQIVKVEYPQRSKAKIVEAYYQTPSTTDYNGLYRGKYIDYEAKQTNNLSFSFKHIFPHQIEHLLRVDSQGGIAFVIIYFKKIDKIYLIDIKDFNRLYLENLKDGSKSIKASDIESLGGYEAKKGYAPLIDYLKTVDQMYFNEDK